MRTRQPSGQISRRKSTFTDWEMAFPAPAFISPILYSQAPKRQSVPL